jgi:hypothetical protein
MLKNNYFCGEIFFILLEMLEVAEASWFASIVVPSHKSPESKPQSYWVSYWHVTLRHKKKNTQSSGKSESQITMSGLIKVQHIGQIKTQHVNTIRPTQLRAQCQIKAQIYRLSPNTNTVIYLIDKYLTHSHFPLGLFSPPV